MQPNYIQNGELGLLAFGPNEIDQRFLSVYNGDMISPEASHKHHVETRRRKSAGVLGVSIEECSSLKPSVASSPPPDFDAHAHIDFTDRDKKQERIKSKELLAFALKRKRLYRAEA